MTPNGKSHPLEEMKKIRKVECVGNESISIYIFSFSSLNLLKYIKWLKVNIALYFWISNIY